MIELSSLPNMTTTWFFNDTVLVQLEKDGKRISITMSRDEYDDQAQCVRRIKFARQMLDAQESD